MTYACGTELRTRPWFGGSAFVGGRALCSDGKVRAIKRIGAHADTYFSVPASVAVKGRTVRGYVSVSTLSGSDFATEDDPAVVEFRHYVNYQNGGTLPAWNDYLTRRGTWFILGAIAGLAS